MKRISKKITDLKEHYDVIVIGSGYGGSISASRLSRAGKSVCLFEKGKEILVGEYPNNEYEIVTNTQFDSKFGNIGNSDSLYNIHINDELNVVTGCGLGGTSLINANVSLEAKDKVFDSISWPKEIRNGKNRYLKKYYNLTKQMLKPNIYPDDFVKLNKQEAHKKSAAYMGGKFYKTPINVVFKELENGINNVGVKQDICNNCGDCVSGCNIGAKNTTLMNYLPDAYNFGADIFCQIDVSHIENINDKWYVHYTQTSNERKKFNANTLKVSADIVIISAGTLGTNEIMLRSKENGLILSDKLGENLSGNGDVLGFAYNGDDEINGIGYGENDENQLKDVGPCITSIIDFRDENDKENSMIIEEGSIPGGLAKLMIPFMQVSNALIGKKPKKYILDYINKEYEQLKTNMYGAYYGAMNKMQTYLIMSHDSSNGKCQLKNNRLEINWANVGYSDIFKKANNKLNEASDALNASYIKNPIWSKLFNKSIISVHPLGGCCMADDISLGVVDHKNRVFKNENEVHKGLYICDGSVIPTSLAINPLLTICAITERAMEYLAKDYGYTIDYSFPSLFNNTYEKEDELGVEFTEKMSGYIYSSNDITDEKNIYIDSYNKGKKNNLSIEFVLNIKAYNVDQFINQKEHKAKIIGSVTIPYLSAKPLSVIDGEFNLFIKSEDKVDTKYMVYKMILANEFNDKFSFYGYKIIKLNDSLLNIWSDTSTLYLSINKIINNEKIVIAKGIMNIKVDDFMIQMGTIKAINGKNIQNNIEAISSFGKFFAGTLWDNYGNIFAKNMVFNPNAKKRKKRKLNTPTPTIHYFKTEDNCELKLTRYKAGTKGPLMLIHGLGVSSLIFSTDLIKVNLLEYLCANDYDVWLLDFRVSIDLDISIKQSSGDDVARYDFKAAINLIKDISKKNTVQVLAHCWGASTFFMSMLSGLKDVRSIVASQVANDVFVPTSTKIKTGLYMPSFLDKLGIKSLSSYVDSNQNWYEKIYDKALSIYALNEVKDSCNSSVCHRITFNYAPLYNHDNLNNLLHENLHELFANANIRSFEHLAQICRNEKLVSIDGKDIYTPYIDNLNLPICFIHGKDNKCYLPSSTKKTYNDLINRFGSKQYSRFEIDNYGHIDCIFGKNAYKDVFPIIVEHFNKTANK